MYVRSLHSGAVVSQGELARSGFPLGQFPAGSEQALYQQVHGLAVAINQAQGRAVAAAQVGNITLARGEIQTVETLRGYFAGAVQRWRAASEGADPDAFTAFDSFVLALGTWVQASLAALPGVVSAVPKALLDGIFEILSKLRNRVGGFVLPVWAVGALLVLGTIFVASKAEKTRTYRRYVA